MGASSRACSARWETSVSSAPRRPVTARGRAGEPPVHYARSAVFCPSRQCRQHRVQFGERSVAPLDLRYLDVVLAQLRRLVGGDRVFEDVALGDEPRALLRLLVTGNEALHGVELLLRQRGRCSRCRPSRPSPSRQAGSAVKSPVLRVGGLLSAEQFGLPCQQIADFLLLLRPGLAEQAVVRPAAPQLRCHVVGRTAPSRSALPISEAMPTLLV